MRLPSPDNVLPVMELSLATIVVSAFGCEKVFLLSRVTFVFLATDIEKYL